MLIELIFKIFAILHFPFLLKILNVVLSIVNSHLRNFEDLMLRLPFIPWIFFTLSGHSEQFCSG